MSKKLLRIYSIALFALYLGVENFHWFSLESISAHAIYYFEVIWVALVWALFRKINLFGKFTNKQNILLVALLPLGWCVHALAQTVGIVVPFNLNDTETILFLLIIGPVLEELVFRGALWRLVEEWTPKALIPALVTTLFFAYSHFQVFQSVPEGYQSFILYQTAYTLILAMVCANVRMRSGLIAAIAAHMIFNFGFWLGR